MPWAAIIPAVVSLAATWYAQDQANKRNKEAQEAQKAGEMTTQQIDKWTPEQQQLFKGLMNATLKRGFDPGGGLPGGQFRSPTVVNRAFQPTGNVPSYGR